MIEDNTMTDQAIVELFFERNETALKHTELIYGKLIFRVCQTILENRQDSEECVNTVYEKLWNTIPPERPCSLKAYIIRVSRFVALDKYRTEHRQKRITSDMTESLDDLSGILHDSYDVEDDLLQKETTRLLNDYIRSLPRQKQSVFVKRYYYNYSISEIADEDGVSIRQVKRMLNKMKKELKTILM